MSFDVAACAAGDGQRGVGAIVVVWAFDGDVATAQEDRPKALPFGLTSGNGAGALAVIMSYLVFILSIEYGVVEAQDVAQRHIGWMELLHGVGDGVFNDMHGGDAVRAGRGAVAQQVGEHHARENTNHERERCAEDKCLLHEMLPPYKIQVSAPIGLEIVMAARR